MFASRWSFAISRLGLQQYLRASNGALSVIFSLLLGLGVVVQRDYTTAWDLQQRFWASLVLHVPELDDGTVVLVDPAGMIDARYIDANTWNLPLVMQYVFEFPDEWEDKPEVHRLLPDWQERSLFNSSQIKAVDYSWQYVIVPWEKVILLETQDGEVSGRILRVDLGGGNFISGAGQLRERSFRPGLLYGPLIERADQVPR